MNGVADYLELSHYNTHIYAGMFCIEADVFCIEAGHKVSTTFIGEYPSYIIAEIHSAIALM